MSSVQLKTYAKINLSLDVTGVKEDGYHEVSMIMQAVDLYDELSVTVRPSPADRVIIRSDSSKVPADESNTAYQAAQVMLELYKSLKKNGRVKETETSGVDLPPEETETSGVDLPPEETETSGVDLPPEETETSDLDLQPSGYEIYIDIKKNIPVAAGLAGGSSNAAGVILALNKILEMNLTMDRLCAAGERVGADVPFCVLSTAACQQELFGMKGGATCVLAEGIGEIMTPLRSVIFWVVLAKPPVSISTAAVYHALDQAVIPKHPETTGLIEGISAGNMQKIKASMCNVLENVTFEICPQSRQLKERMSGKGSIAAMMSGSGPTVFSLFSTRHRAQAMVDSLRDMEKDGFRIFLTKTL